MHTTTGLGGAASSSLALSEHQEYTWQTNGEAISKKVFSDGEFFYTIDNNGVNSWKYNLQTGEPIWIDEWPKRMWGQSPIAMDDISGLPYYLDQHGTIFTRSLGELFAISVGPCGGLHLCGKVEMPEPHYYDHETLEIKSMHVYPTRYPEHHTVIHGVAVSGEEITQGGVPLGYTREWGIYTARYVGLCSSGCSWSYGATYNSSTTSNEPSSSCSMMMPFWISNYTHHSSKSAPVIDARHWRSGTQIVVEQPQWGDPTTRIRAIKTSGTVAQIYPRPSLQWHPKQLWVDQGYPITRIYALVNRDSWHGLNTHNPVDIWQIRLDTVQESFALEYVYENQPSHQFEGGFLTGNTKDNISHGLAFGGTEPQMLFVHNTAPNRLQSWDPALQAYIYNLSSAKTTMYSITSGTGVIPSLRLLNDFNVGMPAMGYGMQLAESYAASPYSPHASVCNSPYAWHDRPCWSSPSSSFSLCLNCPPTCLELAELANQSSGMIGGSSATHRIDLRGECVILGWGNKLCHPPAAGPGGLPDILVPDPMGICNQPGLDVIWSPNHGFGTRIPGQPAPTGAICGKCEPRYKCYADGSSFVPNPSDYYAGWLGYQNQAQKEDCNDGSLDCTWNGYPANCSCDGSKIYTSPTKPPASSSSSISSTSSSTTPPPPGSSSSFSPSFSHSPTSSSFSPSTSPSTSPCGSCCTQCDVTSSDVPCLCINIDSELQSSTVCCFRTDCQINLQFTPNKSTWTPGTGACAANIASIAEHGWVSACGNNGLWFNSNHHVWMLGCNQTPGTSINGYPNTNFPCATASGNPSAQSLVWVVTSTTLDYPHNTSSHSSYVTTNQTGKCPWDLEWTVHTYSYDSNNNIQWQHHKNALTFTFGGCSGCSAYNCNVCGSSSSGGTP
tara:strand:- start:1338 stop:4019 length:2682 start_codon:yes stop_codon:yes gene_type:complete